MFSWGPSVLLGAWSFTLCEVHHGTEEGSSVYALFVVLLGKSMECKGPRGAPYTPLQCASPGRSFPRNQARKLQELVGCHAISLGSRRVRLSLPQTEEGIYVR